jgi:GLPGLI family protein
MKQKWILALLLGTLAATHLQAQMREGKITYEQKINIHKRMPPEAEQFKAMVPEFQTNILELYFTETQSLFKAAKEQGDQLPTADGGGGMGRGFMRFGGMGADAETFRDYDRELIIESRELGPKRYLIEDTLRPLKWKLENETMTINGFECRKATTTIQGFGMGGMRMGGPGGAQGGGRRGADSTITRMLQEPQQVVAWYTEQIETAAGPDSYFGLPGLILYLDIDDGTIVYSPKKLEPLGKETVKAPTKGNKITREEYRKMMQQQFQGMGGRPTSGFMIRQ